MNHALVHPLIDRNLPPDKAADVCVHAENETDNGLIVPRAKIVATDSAITNGSQARFLWATLPGHDVTVHSCSRVVFTA